jgi:glycosyltransferase involved in cell wall biosynthesis
MKAPRVLMLLHDYYPEEVRVVSEARAAAAAGFEVDVLALRGPDEAPEELLEGVRVIRLPVAHRHGGGKLELLDEYVRFTGLSAWKAVRLSRYRPYDVVHVHNPPDFLVAGSFVPRLLGAKVVLDIHDRTPEMAMMRFENARGGGVDRVLRFVERSAAKASDAVLTVHEPYRRELVADGIPAEKISLVMNSLDESVLPRPATSGDERRNGFRIVYHGTITPHYGVGLIVEAAALARPSIPDLRIEIYGAGDAIPDVTERAQAHGLDDVLTIVPRFLPQPEVLRAIQSASAGVCANLPTYINRFALPTKLLEYVALGIPAVTADLATIRQFFSDDEVWFFQPGDAASLARALEGVAGDPVAAGSRVEAARRRYEAYRWEHSASVYTELLWQLASRRRRGRAAQRPTAAS